MASHFPNGLEARPGRVVFHAFSQAAGSLLDFRLEHLRKMWGEETWQRFQRNRGSNPPLEMRWCNGLGMAKTHEVVLWFHGKSDAALVRRVGEKMRVPPRMLATGRWNCASDAFGPYHHYDPDRFPAVEKRLSQAFDEFRDVISRLRPHYGFYDHGRGIPHYMTRTKDTEGEVVYTYSGYRRGYDIGYGRTMVPWLLYLRSGDRRYLDHAIANSRHMMDIRTIHWESPDLNRYPVRRGVTRGEYATWALDCGDAVLASGLKKNNWIEYLLLDYYTTGYERAFDVAREIMEAIHDRGWRAGYVATVALYNANALLMYRATWDPRYWRLHRWFLGRHLSGQCEVCGGFASVQPKPHFRHAPGRHGTKRSWWVEYSLCQMLQAPPVDAKVDTAAGKFAGYVRRTRMRGQKSAYSWPYNPHALWMGYQLTRDPVYAYLAQQVVKEAPTKLGFLRFDGLRPAYGIPVCMELADIAEAGQVRLPRRRQIRRIADTPLLFLHRKGKPTRVTIRSSGELTARVFSPAGKEITRTAWSHDKEWNESRVSLTADSTSGAYEVRFDRPEGAAGNPWAPSPGITLEHAADTELVLAIPDGAGYAEWDKPMSPVWFTVPGGTKRVRIRTADTLGTSKPIAVTLTLPDGRRLKGSGPVWDVTVNAAEDMVVCLKQDTYRQFLKLYGIPPYIAFQKESAFVPERQIETTPDRTVSPDRALGYVPGALPGSPREGALFLKSGDELRVPLGAAVDGVAREGFDPRRGTLEFFFKLTRPPRQSVAEGLPVVIPFAKTYQHKASIGFLLRLDYKNEFLMADRHTLLRFAGIGPREHGCGPEFLQAGRWYHLALQWELKDEKGKTRLVAYLDGVPSRLRGGHGGLKNYLIYRPVGIEPAPPGPQLIVGKRGYEIVLDELRISDSLRYPFWERIKPPTTPFRMNRETRLLMHFDGDVGALLRGGRPVRSQLKRVRRTPLQRKP